MTPTEQYNELQKAVWASLASQITHAINCTDLEHEEQDSCEDFTKKNFEQLMHLITADRKRVALKARISAAEHIQNTMVSPTGGYCDEISPNEIPDYIAELKEELEKL